VPAAPGLGRAPEGQSQLGEIRNVELAVLYFPFRQTTPIPPPGFAPIFIRRVDSYNRERRKGDDEESESLALPHEL
jgi:hypothetical protein